MGSSKSKSVLLIIFGIALVVSALLNFWTLSELRSFKDDARMGFPVEGTYRTEKENPLAPTLSLARDADDGSKGSWQFRPTSDLLLEGEYEATGDPNVFTLKDQAGKKQGGFHVCYSDEKGSGFAYLELDGIWYGMERVGAAAFIEGEQAES